MALWHLLLVTSYSLLHLYSACNILLVWNTQFENIKWSLHVNITAIHSNAMHAILPIRDQKDLNYYYNLHLYIPFGG